jgi:hypothetical protein
MRVISREECPYSHDELVDENYEYWQRKFQAPAEMEVDDCCKKACLNLPTTHTFPAYKSWEVLDEKGKQVSDSEGNVQLDFTYPYKDILFQDRAIVSDGRRESRSKFRPNEPKRKMSRARSIKLNWFVSCYHGIHDPYYAGYPKRPRALPFGVFVSKDMEKFPHCNASLRDIDLSNPEVTVGTDPKDIYRYFLRAKDARELLPLEIASDKKFNNKFFEYWGKDTHWNDPHKWKNQWQWKYEFHFFLKIPVTKVEAILWPDFAVFNSVTGLKESWAIEELSEFRAIYPDIKVIAYPWDVDKAGKSFWCASYKVAKCYYRNGRWPDSWMEALHC